MVFGGDSFKDWIGELSMLNEMAKTAEVLGDEEDKEGGKPESVQGADSSASATGAGSSTAASGTGTDVVHHNGEQLDVSHTSDSHMLSSEEIERRKKKKISKQQREEILRLHDEAKQAKRLRVEELSKVLIARIEKYNSAKANPDGLASFTAKLNQELEDLKIESFGLELLHQPSQCGHTIKQDFRGHQNLLQCQAKDRHGQEWLLHCQVSIGCPVFYGSNGERTGRDG